jgi:hypothetical protein
MTKLQNLDKSSLYEAYLAGWLVFGSWISTWI